MILWPAAKIQILPLAKKFTGTGKEIDAYVTSVNFVMLLHMSKCKPGFIGKISLTSLFVIICANQTLIGCRNKGSFVPVVATFK